MMREIKFRAWIRGQRRMSYADINTMNKWSMPVASWADIMQFTGLKDKNGQDVYEGDIIDYEGIRKQEGVSRTFLAVKWSHQDACFAFGGIRTDYAVRYGIVIGNIYENPELI